MSDKRNAAGGATPAASDGVGYAQGEHNPPAPVGTSNTPVPASTYADAAHPYRTDGWPCVLPLPPGAKTPPPSGFTGWPGVDTSGADIAELAEVPRYQGTAQTALRMPPTVIGIDVDHYAAKRGGATLAEAVRQWGPLPAGPWSSARDDGTSGIRFFRVPAGTVLRTVLGFPALGLGDVEIIQRHHRYAVVWPSVHPATGAPYTWRGTAGPGLGPRVDELPELPAAWVEGLRNDDARPGRHAADDTAVRRFLAQHAEGRRPWTGVLTAFRRAVERGSRHDAVVAAACMAAREAGAGQYPAQGVHDALGAAFWDAVAGDGSRTEATAAAEYAGAWCWAVGQLDGLGREDVQALTADARRPKPEPGASGGFFWRDEPWPIVPGATAVAERPAEPRVELRVLEGGEGAPKPFRRLRVITASAVRPKVARWLWEPEEGYGRIPLGELSVVAGRGNVGKSPFCLWCAARLTRGELPGAHHGAPVDVLIYASEDSLEHTIVPRLMAAAADLDRVHFLAGTESDADPDMPLSWTTDLPLIEDEVVARGAAALIIDPLVDVHRAGANTDRTDEVRDGLRPLVNMAHRTGCSVLGIAHWNKKVTGDLAALLSGAHGLRDLARSVLAFVQSPDGSKVLGQDKNNLGRAGDEMPRLTYAMRSVMVPIDGELVSTPAFEITGETEATLSDLVTGGGGEPAAADLPADLVWLFERIAEVHPLPIHTSTLRDEVAARDIGTWDAVSRRLRKTRLVVPRREGGAVPVHVWVLTEEGARRAGLPGVNASE